MPCCLQKVRFWGTACIPFFVMFVLGEIFSADMNIWVKTGLFVVCLFLSQRLGRLVCDDRFMNIFPISVYFATKVRQRSWEIALQFYDEGL